VSEPAFTDWLASPGHLVEASAGTGKTTKLVAEFVRTIQKGADVRRTAAVTFTHAAAGELKLRIRQKLDEAVLINEDTIINQRVRAGIEKLEQAFIGTIHGFCGHCLRQRPVEAALDPSFVELSEMESSALFGRVFRRWLERRLVEGSATLKRAFCRLAYKDERNEDAVASLRDAAWKIADWRDFPAKWRRPASPSREQLDALLTSLAEVTGAWKAVTSGYQFLKSSLIPAAELGERVAFMRAAGCVDYDSLEAELCYVGRRRYESNDFTALYRIPDCFQQWQILIADLTDYSQRADAEFAADLRDELWEMVTEYDAAKRAAGVVDFQDLLLKTRDLLLNRDARIWFQKQYDHVFVDEFQDTDPLQAEVIMLLTASDPFESNWKKVTPASGKLFLVGDPKQSIYRFRRAEVSLYLEIADQLARAGATPEPLSVSHRSNSAIQKFVNGAFESRMQPYLPLEGGREAQAGQPGVVALPVPHIFNQWGKPTKGKIEESAPKAVAGFIQWLINTSRWKIRRRDGSYTAISENDICILFRRFTADTTRGYVHSLECRSISHVLVGSKSLHEREEVMTICSALKAIEHPDDELNVYATLRGSLFAIEDAELFKFKENHRRINYTKIPPESDDETAGIREALESLSDLHRRRNSRPIAATIGQLLEQTRAHVGFALRPGGERVLANVNRIVDLARRFEVSAATSFRSFVEYLDDEAGTKEAGEAPLLEQDADGVKLMTVHKAKGLEFPVVILADPTCNAVGEGDRYTDTSKGLCVRRLLSCAPLELREHEADEQAAEQAEADRLAYVAATRASDLMVVAAIGTQMWENGWLSPLAGALYPANADWSHPRPYPTFTGRSSVLDVPSKGSAVPTVMPGWHKPACGSHEVLWFDPLLISEEPKMAAGLSTHELIAGDPARTLSVYKTWSDSADAARERGRQRQQIVITATGSSEEYSPSRLRVETITVRAATQQKFSRHFGRLVHGILQDVDFAASMSDLQTLATAYARSMRRPPAEAGAAAEIVRHVLTHPLLLAAREAREVLREEPFVLRTPQGVLIEGKIDLAYRSLDGWTLIDYKTGQVRNSQYERQVRWYAMALQASDGLPVRCVLLEIG
jgi:ATP-dependent exoDNAse (exonuclease V) beta subunit